MKNKNKDMGKAMRIAEALSGVDGELIERSENISDTGKDKSNAASGRSSTMMAFTKYLAVCAVFIFLCMGAFGIYIVTWHSGASSAADAADTAYDEYMAENAQEAEEQMLSTGTESVLEDGNGQTLLSEDEALSSLKNSGAEAEYAEMAVDNYTENMEKMKTTESMDISEVDAAVAAHIPTLVPDRFTLDSCTSVANDEVYAGLTLMNISMYILRIIIMFMMEFIIWRIAGLLVILMQN
ncbi:MAG: hypothetical protein LUG83_04550 [Lachnospiraceae bacterium]|nr:hypothetical protein [Lachnospiraceae bacterium]